VSLLVTEVMLAPLIIAQTVSQMSASIALRPVEVAGPVTRFVIVAVVAAWVLVSILRGISAPDRQAR
jgi:predicted Na+-dependent transporter